MEDEGLIGEEKHTDVRRLSGGARELQVLKIHRRGIGLGRRGRMGEVVN
jgi:hypothetical protein